MDQLNRPRTRGLEASEAEEDAKLIKAALKEPIKFVKRAHQKLRSDYGGRKDTEESDEEDKIFYQQPPYDDDESAEVKVVRRRRGGGRRTYVRKRARGDDEPHGRRPMSAKFAAALKEELKPKIVPCTKLYMEYNQILYKLGDIVSTLDREDHKEYYAQIVGFHSDQFCERYVSIRWLLPRWKFDPSISPANQPPITAFSFRGAIPGEEPLKLSSFRFVLRPTSFHSDNPGSISRSHYYTYNFKKYFINDSPPTLTSADRRY